MSNEPLADLASTIKQLRAELSKAMTEGQKQELLFGLGPVELELHMEITNETKGGGGIRFSILNLGASRSRDNSKSNRITLTLHPLDSNGDPARIASYGKSEIPSS